MASVERWKVLCCVLFVLLRVIKTEIVTTDSAGRPRGEVAPEFSRHTLVKPRMYHGREKREISTTQEQTGEEGHIHDLTIGYNVHGRDYVLDLRLNRDLIPKSYFERYQHNGQHVVNRPTGKDVELCQYQGRLRGLADSWAAISTCHGISGVIFDGEELHYLEKSSPAGGREEEDSGHFLYRHSDLKENQTCGYSGTPHHILENQEFNRILRYKRNTEVIRGPYNANKQSRYVELVLVVDNKLYKDMGENLQKVYSHCKEIANIINSLYVPLNIFIALVGVVVWTEFDEITLSANGDTTLTNFLHYRRERLVKEHPNDNAQLLTRVQFDGGVVGKALKGPICTYEFSGGVSMDHSSVVGLVATTVAHEMGHNFGMEHDTSDCDCPSDRCIMAPSSSSMTPTQWSSCSLGYLALAFEHGMDYCLRNKPDRLFDSPVCGNGFVEAGEQCDCGLKEQCDNPCCNATSCMLYSNASCATGECCDLKTCHPKNAGSACRSSDHECDLPEYCTGHSEYCPDDVFKMDGETCDRGMAFCYQGSCRTHSDQCRLLWGPSGKSSDKQCYEMNTKGSRHGNCGYNRFNQSFIKCGNENIQCGMLHCKHLNERLEFGMESVAILSHSFINAGGSIIPCRTAIVDLGLNQVDPGLAPDGAKCGDGKMCVNQKCMSVGSLRKGGVCPNACSGNGVCNSLGHCHCIVGFPPPNCDYPGTGGSEDSGPASDPNARRDVMTALYIIFLGIVPLVALIALFMYYTRHNVKHWWKKGGHPAIPGPAVTNSSRNLPSSKQGNKKSPQQHISRGNSMAFRNNQRIEISDPLPSNVPNGSDSDHTSLLPKHEGCNGVAPIAVPSSAAGNANPANLQTNLFGHFKGFSITPIHSSPMKPSSPSKLPSPPSRTPSAVSPPTVPPLSAKPTRPLSIPSKPNILNRNASSVGLAVTSANSVATSMAPDLPPANSLSTSRPVISSPVLDTTTCTAKELMTSARPAPTRPAPQVPVSLPSSNKTAPKLPRPLSSPNTLTVNPIVEEKKGKDSPQSYPTLTRLASFMLRQNASAPSQANEKNHEKGKGKPTTDDKTNSLPRKANKLQIDREALRNLKISNPIPQQDIDVPDSALSVGLEDDAKQVVMRAQSMRDPAPATQRPAIPTFGSMRQPSAGNAPLANIDEESSPTSGDNIYAVIEESPPERAKPASVVTKPAPAVPSSVANLHKGRVSRNESPAANSPDVVSSCSIGNIGNTGKSPDVLGGKGVLKTTSKAPDVVSGGVVKPQSSNTATVTRASVVPSIHSVHSSVGSTVSKASNSSASKPTSINSSLRGSVAGKHSQAEVKPIGAKQSSVASGGRVPGDKTRASTPGAASKETPGKTSSSGRGATDVGANRTMPAGARVAASKLSHVASLQQKFETAASSGDKSGSVGGRTLSNVSNKTKLTPSTVKKSATVKK